MKLFNYQKNIFFILILTTPLLSPADPIFRVNRSSNIAVNKFGICKRVTNSSPTNDYMIPTGTITEWDAFRTHLPAGVTLGADASCSFNSSLCTGAGYDVEIQSDLKIVTGALCRYNVDGTTDGTLSIGTGFDSSIRGVEILSDGTIVAGGMFSNYNGTAKSYIVALNNTGAISSSFITGTGFDSYVFTTTKQADEKILAGGRFGSYKGSATANVIRINTDGSRDSGFAGAAVLPEDVYGLASQTDNKVLVAGDSYSSTAKNFTRLNADGTVDSTCQTNKGTSTNARASSVAQQADGKILVSGQFTQFNGTTVGRLVRLNADCTLDTAFNTNIGTGFTNNAANSIAIQPDGKIVIVGTFTQFNGSSQNRIIRLNSDGTKDTGFTVGTGLNNSAEKVIIATDERVIVTGSFTSYNGTTSATSTYYLIRINKDGTL